MKSTNFKLNSPPKQRNNKKFVVLLVVIALLIGVGSIALVSRQNHQNALQAEQKAQDEAQTDSSKKVGNNKNDGNTPSDAKAASQTTDQIPNAQNSNVKIVDFQQGTSEVSATATVIANDSSGYCVFSYTSAGGRPVISSRINLDEGTCRFTKPANSFDYIGSWNLNVTYYINGTKVEANKDVAIS